MGMLYVWHCAMLCYTHVRQLKSAAGPGPIRNLFLSQTAGLFSLPLPKTSVLYLQLAGSCTDWRTSSHSASRTCVIATTF